MSEFGRTPRINGHLGRDHWPRGVVAGHGRLRHSSAASSSARPTTRAPTSTSEELRHRPPVPHLVPRSGHRPGDDASTTTAASRCRSPTRTATPSRSCWPERLADHPGRRTGPIERHGSGPEDARCSATSPGAAEVLKPDRAALPCSASAPAARLLAAGGFDGTVRRWDSRPGAAAELAAADRPRRLGAGPRLPPRRQPPVLRRLLGPARAAGPVADEGPRTRSGRSPRPTTAGSARLAVSPDGDRRGHLRPRPDRPPLVGRRRREAAGNGPTAATTSSPLAFHPDGKSLVSGDLQGRHPPVGPGRRRDACATLDARVALPLRPLQDVGGVRCLAFDHAGKLLACAGARRPRAAASCRGRPTLLLFDWATGAADAHAEGRRRARRLRPRPALARRRLPDGRHERPAGQRQALLHASRRHAAVLPRTDDGQLPRPAVHPDGRRLVVAATNASSNGNGRRQDQGEYRGNWSPLHVWDLPGPDETSLLTGRPPGKAASLTTPRP